MLEMLKINAARSSDFPNNLVDVIPYLEKRFIGKPKTEQIDKELQEVIKQIEYHFVSIGIFGSHSGGQLVELLNKYLVIN